MSIVVGRQSVTTRDRLYRPMALGLFLLFVVELVALSDVAPLITVDYDRYNYMAATQRFLETGTPYIASEVAGRFDYTPATFLHPPLALWLMVPASFLPAFVWYALPLGVLGWFVWTSRPSPVGLAVIAACLAWPRTAPMILNGNTDLWVTAFSALSLRYGWGGPLVLIKPSLFPLALSGIRHRAWWLGLTAVVVLAVPFGSLWLDWIRVALNAPGGIVYSLGSLPFVSIPIVAWWTRREATVQR